MSENLRFIEHCPFNYNQESPIISITPMASYLLDKNNIKHETLAPSHDPGNQKQEEYLNLQVKWLNALDENFSKHLAALTTETKHYWLYQIHFIKSIMDILAIRAWQLNNIMQKEKPKNVCLYTYLNRLKTPAHSLNFIGKPTATELVLSEASNRYCFNLDIIKTINSDDICNLNGNTKKNNIGKAKKILNVIYKLKETAQFIPNLLVKKYNKLNILACSNTYGIPDVLSKMRSKGHSTFVFNNRSLFLHSSAYSGKEVFQIDDKEFQRELKKQKSYLTDIVKELDDDNWLLNWYDDFCGLPMSKHVIPRLRQYAFDELSQILVYEKYCSYILNEFHINYIIAPSLSSHSDFGFILSSKGVNTCYSAIIMHGNSWFKSKIWAYCELYPFDIFFASDQEFADYHSARAKELNMQTAVYVGGGRLQKNTLINLSKTIYSKYIYRKKLKNLLANTNRPLVVYVPTMYMGDRRVMNFPYFSDTWYYELQKTIITTFGKQHNFNFIVKLLENGDSLENPLKQFINDLQAPNILLREDIFFHWLYNADILIFDFPSTALYEAMAVEKPFFILLHDTISIRDAILNDISDKLRDYVGRFSEIHEVELLIKKFLNYYKNLELISYEEATIENIVSVLERRNDQ